MHLSPQKAGEWRNRMLHRNSKLSPPHTVVLAVANSFLYLRRLQIVSSFGCRPRPCGNSSDLEGYGAGSWSLVVV